MTTVSLPAEPVVAGPGDSPAQHLRAKLDTELRALTSREPGTRAGKDPEDLHQMRVATRRMRSVLKLGRQLLGPEAEQVRAELGWLGAALGEVRDYDVLIGHLREVVADFEVADQAAGRRLVSEFVRQRGQAKRRLNRALSSERYAALLSTAARLTQRPDIEPGQGEAEDGEARTVLVGSLRKPHRRLVKAAAALPEDPPDDDLHALRIHSKRLRYAAELARPAAGRKQAKRLRGLVKAAKRLQTVLGDHQDAVVAVSRMRDLLGTATGADAHVGFVAGRIVERELAKRAEARRRWRGLVADIDAAARAVLP